MNTENTDFENYLRARHAEQYHGTDDEMPDAFESWLADLEAGDLVVYAEEAIQLAKEGKL